MQEKFLFKLGFYSLYEVKTEKATRYKVDSGKTITLKQYNKTVVNKYRDVKEFPTLDKAKKYVKKKLAESSYKKKKKLEKLPKSLYLVLIREIESEKVFVKVGITSKKFIIRRFSKDYGYDGYELLSILRRVESKNTIQMESNIKEKLNKKRSVQKYRPLLESFSGYSECYNYDGVDDIIKIFDDEVLKNA